MCDLDGGRCSGTTIIVPCSKQDHSLHRTSSGQKKNMFTARNFMFSVHVDIE